MKAAVEAVLAEPLPDDAARRVAERARRLAVVTLPPAQTPRRPAAKLEGFSVAHGAFAAAAAVAAVAIGVAVLLDRSGGRAFAHVIERIRAASTVQFSTSFKFGQRPAQKGRMSLEGQRLRFEQFEGALVSVADFDRQQAVLFDMPRKQFREINIADKALHGVVNPIDQLRQAKSDDAESLGEERLDGRLTRVYRLDKVDLLGMKGNAETMVWIDVASELPAQIVIRDADPKHPTELRFTEFVWNEPLDAELFSLETPAGFTRSEGEEIVVAPEAKRAGAEEGAAMATPAIVDGVLNDRVPAVILWGPQGGSITALMRDPESTPASGRRQNALRQWDAATGELRWSHPRAGRRRRRSLGRRDDACDGYRLRSPASRRRVGRDHADVDHGRIAVAAGVLAGWQNSGGGHRRVGPLRRPRRRAVGRRPILECRAGKPRANDSRRQTDHVPPLFA